VTVGLKMAADRQPAKKPAETESVAEAWQQAAVIEVQQSAVAPELRPAEQ